MHPVLRQEATAQPPRRRSCEAAFDEGDDLADLLPSGGYAEGAAVSSGASTPRKAFDPFQSDADLYVLDVSPPAPPPAPIVPKYGTVHFAGDSGVETEGPTTAMGVDRQYDVAVEEFVFPDATCDAAIVYDWLRELGIQLRRPWELLVRDV